MLAATRAASVDAARSWSASSTSAAFERRQLRRRGRRAPTACATAARRSTSHAASPASGRPSTSVAISPRPTVATASGRRSWRSGSVDRRDREADPHAVDQRRLRREIGRRPRNGRDCRLVGRRPDCRLAGVDTGPQPLRDPLVARLAARRLHVPAAVVELPGRVEQRERAVDDDREAGRRRAAARPRGQPVDLGRQVAAAAVRAGDRMADQLPAAHVGVQRRQLDAETLGGLGRGVPLVDMPRDSNIDS